MGYIKAKGGEAGSAPIESITYAQLHLPNVLECVPEECILNVDESGLLYNQKPCKVQARHRGAEGVRLARRMRTPRSASL